LSLSELRSRDDKRISACKSLSDVIVPESSIANRADPALRPPAILKVVVSRITSQCSYRDRMQ
jgi:hypothetical protein